MKALLAFFCAAILLTPAEGTVVIYKGTARQKQTFSPTPAFGGATVLGYYLLVDYDTKLVSEIVTFAANGKKQYGQHPPFSMRFAAPVLVSGRVATIISSSSTTDSAEDNFAFQMFTLTGTNFALTVRKESSPLQLNIPRSFSGSFQNVTRNGDQSSQVVRTYVATLQAAATLKANAAGQTIQNATLEIIDQLEAKGFITQ